MPHAEVDFMKTLLLSLALVGSLWVSQQARAVDEPKQRLSVVIELLDGAAKEAKVEPLSTLLAELLKMPKSEVTKHLTGETNKASDLVLAQFVAEKTKRSYESVLQAETPPRNWRNVLAANHIKEGDAVDRVSLVYGEVAFKLLDRYADLKEQPRKPVSNPSLANRPASPAN